MKEIWIARLNDIKEYLYFRGIVDGFYLNYDDHYIVFHSYGKGINHKGRTKGLNWKRWNSRNNISIKVSKMSGPEIELITYLEKLKVEDLIKIVEHYKDYFETCGFVFDPKKLGDVVFD
jgi:hypothetical protein